MPSIDFDVANKKATTNYDYPKLKLKSGEKARVLLLESPVYEYVHTLKAPTIVNGQPVIVQKERKNGEKYDDYKTDFITRAICLGDASILEDKGNDPKNCPICALAKENSDYAQAPERRFAMHVVRYKTSSKGTGFDLITPFSVDVLVWAFTERVFGQIVDFKAEWGDLRKHDLTLGPCTNEMFQQFDINVGAKAAWLEDQERQKLTAETFKNNQIDDLSIACGTRKERKWLEEDIEKVRANWKIAVGAPASAAEAAELSAELDDDLSSLMDSVSTPAKTEPTPKAAEPDLADDLLGDLLDTPAETEAPAATAEASAEEPEIADLDDLLADLD